MAAGTEGGKLISYPAKSDDIIAFSREKDGSKVVVAANLGNEKTSLEFTADAPAVAGMKDFFSGADAAIPESLNPGEYIVFINK